MPEPYSFLSRWELPVSASRAWEEVERLVTASGTGAQVTWWRAVRVARPARTLADGEHLDLVVRSPVGYRLRVRLLVDRVEPPHLLTATSVGDLDGRGRLRITPVGDEASVVEIHWHVATRRPWMNRTAWLLRPIFRRAHAHVMRAGERGLRRRVEGAQS